MMEITEIKISLNNDEKLKGFVNIVLDDLFVVRGLKIIRGMKGYFIAMPTRRLKDGSFRDIAHPIKSDFRTKLEKAILDKYREEISKIQENSSAFIEYGLL
jgi:stage V sporulation protein G